MNDEILFDASLEVVDLLSKKDYDQLKRRGYFEKISAEDAEEIISGYSEINELDGGIMPLTEKVIQGYRKYFDLIASSDGKTYWAHLDLYIGDDDERSDLTLILEIEVENDKITKITIEDIHVM